MLEKILMLCIIVSPQINTSSLVDKFFVKPCKTLLHDQGAYEVEPSKTITKRLGSVDGSPRNVTFAAYKHSPELRLQRANDVEEASQILTYGLGGMFAASVLAHALLATTNYYVHRATAIAGELTGAAFILMSGKNYFDTKFRNELDYCIRLAKHNNDKDAIFNLAWKKT